MLGIHISVFLVACVGSAAAFSVIRPENILEAHHVERRQASFGTHQQQALFPEGNIPLPQRNSQGLLDSSEDVSLESLKDSKATQTSGSEGSRNETPRISLRTSPIQARTRTASVLPDASGLGESTINFPVTPADPPTLDLSDSTVSTLVSPAESNASKKSSRGKALRAPATDNTLTLDATSPFEVIPEVFAVGTRVIVTAPPRPCAGVCQFRARNGRCYENFRCRQEMFSL
ncbi:uncharacterized protein LOC122257148 isoform X2 [Penaeus japonicus]|uniref:uncharacterized protein LOC122257148 isoform X2 n=1 Tax=Penaeus japonicus TaxID=27405 RepID=UPI001C70B869|nr:uncharacterized protein LOC122257148 isoform X2 [Penaeus japonicus]XP_042878172.1 uncharacterized protein LOC122257148 isoform X2 [Penaeus japonicus]